MLFLWRNFTVLTIALLLGSLAWVYGGTRGDLLLSFVPWLWVLLVESMIAFPQRRENETHSEARLRVWAEMRRDPLVWVSVALLLLLAVPFVNPALCPNCDAAEIAKGAEPGAFAPFLPFCYNRLEHLNVYLWFLSALTAMIATKHSLTKSGQRTLIEILVWNGVAMGVLGFVQQATGALAPFWLDSTAPNVYFFSTFGYANMGGDYFTALFCLSIAVWRWHSEDVRVLCADGGGGELSAPYRQFWAKHYALIAAGVLFASAVATLSRSAILMVSAAAVVLLVHTGMMFLSRLDKIQRLKAGAAIGVFVLLIATFASMMTPDRVRKEMASFGATEALNRVTGRSEHGTQAALSLIDSYPLFGCGGWGFKHECVQRLPRSVTQYFKYDWSRGSLNVHNDYLQFMDEHGLVGFGLLLAIFVLQLLPVAKIWKSLIAGIRFADRRKLPPPPRTVFILPASALATLIAMGATLVHAFGDCPLRSPAVFSLLLVELSAIQGYLPRLTKKD